MVLFRGYKIDVHLIRLFHKKITSPVFTFSNPSNVRNVIEQI